MRGAGAVDPVHPMGGSIGGTEADIRHREELFGRYREEAMRGDVAPPDEEMQKNARAQQSSVTPEEARRVYRTYWTTGLNQREVARQVDRCNRTVSTIVNRNGRYGEMLENVAEELGYPEEKR